MENENLENNRNAEDISDTEENKFNYTFIDTPWDDRSERSKMGVIALLVAIIAATTALVINNLVIHYRGFHSRSFNSNTEIDCNVVKLDDYPYAARIHLISSNELVCVGAVLSRYSVLANELCLKSGPIWLRIGSPTDPRCKKGFTIDLVETIHHDGVVTKNVVLLSIVENMGDCMRTIKIGLNLNPRKHLYVIGRSFRGGRVLSFQLAEYFVETASSVEILRDLNTNDTIAVKTFGKCPVRAGDLLVQKGLLFGLASTSVHRREKTKIVYFANLTAIQKTLKVLDAEVEFSG
ncbi:uncharacterized protein LOC120623285 [Pararge aegeria]|uniref:Jg12829 protein n=1 Tax=Pararge aegeria aegeria TaxID=348720 RepID=A0A8S4RLL5_9NEOP|nr:uncharacterized protein LOC120623285 [Pararge aegeria]CAH2237496.1 jg12829 [Pararge aegeria aegeria]